LQESIDKQLTMAYRVEEAIRVAVMKANTRLKLSAD
jgi:hypothetical protein